MAIEELPPDFREFLQLLASRSVEYLLVGGYAVAYYGYVRATADMEAVRMVRTQVQLTPSQAEQLRRVSAERGVSIASIVRCSSTSRRA